MAMFTPDNQLRNMLQSQAMQTQIRSTNPFEKMLGLYMQQQTQEHARRQGLYVRDNWLDDTDLWI